MNKHVFPWNFLLFADIFMEIFMRTTGKTISFTSDSMRYKAVELLGGNA